MLPFTNFDDRIGSALWSLAYQLAICQSSYDLPFHYTTLILPLGRVQADNITIVRNELTNLGQEFCHQTNSDASFANS